MKKIKALTIGNWFVIILLAYAIAYLMLDGYSNYQVKNQYEQEKIESYKYQYQQFKK